MSILVCVEVILRAEAFVALIAGEWLVSLMNSSHMGISVSLLAKPLVAVLTRPISLLVVPSGNVTFEGIFSVKLLAAGRAGILSMVACVLCGDVDV